jgi:hypothetical protein
LFLLPCTLALIVGAWGLAIAQRSRAKGGIRAPDEPNAGHVRARE